MPGNRFNGVDADEGFDPERRQSPFLRFFVDWAGEVWVVAPGSVPEEGRESHTRVLSAFRDGAADDTTQNDVIANCAKAMPRSAMVFEILDPPRGGGCAGDICYVGFDFSNVHDESHAPMKLVLLED